MMFVLFFFITVSYSFSYTSSRNYGIGDNMFPVVWCVSVSLCLHIKTLFNSSSNMVQLKLEIDPVLHDFCIVFEIKVLFFYL